MVQNVRQMWNDPASVVVNHEEVVVTVTGPKGEKFLSKMKTVTLDSMRKASGPLTLVELKTSSTFEGEYLDGFVRRKGRIRNLSGSADMVDEGKEP